MRGSTTTSSDNDAQHCVTEDDAQDSSRPTSERRVTSPPPSSTGSGAASAPHTPTGTSGTSMLFDIVDADVPHATVMFSTDGVMIRYVIRFLNKYGVRWCVERRYSDLLALHENLRESYESTRSLGTKIASFITSGSPVTSSSSTSTSNPSTSSNVRPLLSSADDNANCRRMFPKFPSKVLGKGTNQSIQLIMSRRRDMSHYFTELVRRNCRSFLRTTSAQKLFCDFCKPPPIVRGPGGGVTLSSIPGLVGATTFQVNAVGSESAYYFREDGDGFLSIEQKSYTYAYFTINEWSVPKRGSSASLSTPGRRSPATPKAGAARQGGTKTPTSSTKLPEPAQTGPQDTPAFRAWLKLCATRSPDAPHEIEEEVRVVPSGKKTSKLSSEHAPPPSSSASNNSTSPSRVQKRAALLDRNGCTNALLPTITICLPYARIVHDLYDTQRIVVALRCEKSEGRAEVIRRRDELVAFYRHVANGGVDRLPDIHEAKRFFVNFRRDNPLQQYGGMTVRLSNNSARTRDRLPSSPNSASRCSTPQRTARSSSPKRKRNSTGGSGSNISVNSDTEGNVDRTFRRTNSCPSVEQGQFPEDTNLADDEEEDPNEGKSLVISLASLRFSAAGAGESPTTLSAPGSFPGINMSPPAVAQEQDTTSSATPTLSATPESVVDREACRNSSHVVGYVLSDEQGAVLETRTKMVRNCICSDHVFCAAQLPGGNQSSGPVSSSMTREGGGQETSSQQSTESPLTFSQSPLLHKKQFFTGFESASGFKIHVFAPLSEKLLRPSSPQKGADHRCSTPPGGVSRKTQNRR
ncbi:Hypothetical protein, putative [Bodo saltans]|uniref:PX domain-containing protein n=1 Tax=Bodo saltans TaxID=75058 RepID=A0A0S4JBH5_BODSA|nr:Hypothetical protein, putative [Bodo saltans]|eukprot:CUG88899.1 Hypothetical protein, putative [Bodo saltans]